MPPEPELRSPAPRRSRARLAGLARKSYDSPAHHFHAPGSPGAQCVNGHMPVKSYMVVDPRRDHSFRVPRTDLSARLGTPNACNACHPDRSAPWAAEAVARWYGPRRREEPHYGETIAAGRSGTPQGGASLIALVDDPKVPAIVRATALKLLSQYGPEGVNATVRAARDADPLVRAASAAALDRIEPSLKAIPVAALLRDPDAANALAVFYIQARDWDRARSFAEKLAELAPGAPQPRRLLEEIEAMQRAAPGSR